MNTKIKCLLLDDELPGLTYLKMICEQISCIEVVRAFNDPQKFVEESKTIDFDLGIIDIEMPGLSGLEVAAQLPGKPIIFTTAYKEYAADAFDLNAIDYIRKPIQKDRLQKAIEKAAEKIQTNKTSKAFVQLNTSKGKSMLYFEQLLFITTSAIDKRDKTAHLDNGDSLILKNISFSQLLEILPPSQFVQINKKEIISLKIVDAYTHEEITSTIQKENKLIRFSLGEAYKAGFISKIAH